MSHELETNSQGIYEAAFRVRPAWHGLGAVLAESASFEDFGKAAGLTTWDIKRANVSFTTEPVADYPCRAKAEFPGQQVLYRSDSGRPLGIVSNQYKIVQPREVFEFFSEFVDVHGFKMEAAGVLRHGGRFWALAQMPGVLDIGGDVTVPYVLLSSSADGSMSTEARFTSTRVVCANTLGVARSKRAEFKLSHRSNFNPDDCKSVLADANANFAKYCTQACQLARFTMTSQQAAVVLAGLLNPKAADLTKGTVDGSEMDETLASKSFQHIMSLFSGGGKGAFLDSSRGTAFGMLQAMTEYYDHHAAARSDENRFINSQYGKNASKKSEALDTLVGLVNA